jgi:ATP-dependent Clp protease ATP-binding subunit ClpA
MVPVFERFTDRARRAVVLAQEEARLLNHNYIGTEHLLLGVLHEGGVAAQALEAREVTRCPEERGMRAYEPSTLRACLSTRSAPEKSTRLSR